MATAWLETLRNSQKTCLIQDGRRKVHFTFKDGKELAEEYDVNDNKLIVRKWKVKRALGGPGKWEYEVGEDLSPRSVEAEGLAESITNPIFTRIDTFKAFQWRIRNLPYSIDVYNVTVDAENRVIIIRTTNKKYYKKFNIPDMDRAELPLSQNNVKIAHANKTLIVTYEKPVEIMQMEKEVQEELKKLKASKDGDVECTPS